MVFQTKRVGRHRRFADEEKTEEAADPGRKSLCWWYGRFFSGRLEDLAGLTTAALRS